MSNFILKYLWKNSFSGALVALIVVTASLRGQPGAKPVEIGRTPDGIELYQALLDLTNVWTVMCVAAHPDDEDGATLTVLRRKYGVHTVSLFSTFGEGGQNAIGPELYEELGAIRAEETLKASRIQGSEPHFLGLKDFGFSKSAEEAFRIWGHDEALRRMVLKIRTLQPDVIITNHDTNGGHGHHQATGRLVLEAFDAAADPKRFPEQLKNVNVWQVQRLFVRMSNEGGASSKALDDEAVRADKVITIDRNERDPARDSTYAAQALHALQQHASQGPWPTTLPKDGWPPVRYRLLRDARATASLPNKPDTFFEGMQPPETVPSGIILAAIDRNVLWPVLNQREQLFKLIAAARVTKFGQPSSSAKQGDVRARLLRQHADSAMAILSGISAKYRSADRVLVPNSRAQFVLDITNAGERDATIQSVTVDGVKQIKGHELASKSTISLKEAPGITTEEQITVPRYAHLYDESVFGQEFSALITVSVGGTSFSIPVSTRVDIAPSVEIASISPSPYIITPVNLKEPLVFKLRLINHQNKPFNGEIGIASGSQDINKIGDAVSLAANETRDIIVRSNDISFGPWIRRASGNTEFRASLTLSVHPKQSNFVISKVETEVRYVDTSVTNGLRIGYVRSFDDTIRNALAALGVESQELSIDEIRTGDLQKFNTIIIDNRGYQAHPELISANSRLMDFTKNGGTLIVFYHKTNEWNEDPVKNRPSLAPFPITLGNERVTDENAPVTFTEPLHPLLNFPNKIGRDDFKDWIQERGLYYPKVWDPRYQSLFVMNDAGEEPLRGGLLVTEFGRGHYIYTSMVWYRQLRAGVPGAYRMFANMISFQNLIVSKRDRAESKWRLAAPEVFLNLYRNDQLESEGTVQMRIPKRTNALGATISARFLLDFVPGFSGYG